MEEGGQQGQDRVASASTAPLPLPLHGGERLVPDNLIEQPLSSNNERIVSPNPSPDAAITGSLRNATDQPETLRSSGAHTPVYPFNSYSAPEQTYFYGASGYDDGTGSWGDYSNYVNANNLQIVPPIYNDNPSILFHPAYGFDTQMAYGQFSPLASPLSPIMVDGQLYSPHQVPMSPSYYPQQVSPAMPHGSSALSLSQTEFMQPATSGQEALSDNMFFGPGSGYYVHYGSFGGGNVSGNSNLGYYKFPGEIGSGEPMSNRSNPSDTSYLSPLTPGAVYPPPVGILGPYEQSFGQIPQQQTQFPGYGVVSSSTTRRYPHSSYRGSNYGSGSISHGEANRLNRFTPDKVGKRDRERDSFSVTSDSHGTSTDRNRGPRASKPRGSNAIEENSSPGVGKNGEYTSRDRLDDLYGRSDFVTNYEYAKFFVIKSFSEDNVHKSIKYNVWASTPLGNKKLDAAYHEAKEAEGTCPVFLFFSVNASGQFCGVAEMVGPVDFENDADYWHQDRWSGQFRVQWHIIKDVPNSRFRHILLENNDNKPVTHSRDSQEVKLEEGLEMLKIFKEHEAETSILDDFNFYDEREKDLHEKKSRERDPSAKDTSSVAVDGASITQLSDKLTESLQLEESKGAQ